MSRDPEWTYPRSQCPCGREVALYQFGFLRDSTGRAYRVLRYHRTPDGGRCGNSRRAYEDATSPVLPPNPTKEPTP